MPALLRIPHIALACWLIGVAPAAAQQGLESGNEWNAWDAWDDWGNEQPQPAQGTEALSIHPAEQLFDYITEDQMNPAYWEERLLANERERLPIYPCPKKTLPVVRQYMLAKVFEKQGHPRFRHELTRKLNDAFTGRELHAMNDFLGRTTEFDGMRLAFTPEELAAVHKHLAKANEINRRYTAQLQRDVMRETKRELKKILNAYSNPDGSCK